MLQNRRLPTSIGQHMMMSTVSTAALRPCAFNNMNVDAERQ